MIKGVNHQIIEVNRTDHPYFERALLFVRTAYAQETTETLQGEGCAFLKQAQAFSALREARAIRWFKRCALVLCGGIGGMLLGICLTNIG